MEQYNASNIELLEGLEGVRKRPAMYIGSSNVGGLHHLVWEILDNAVDEALNGFGNKIITTIHKDGSVSVLDEGRGIPCDIHKKTGLPAVQLIFTTLHSGGKFNENAYKSSAGLHGVGSSVTNALSVYCDVTVYKNNKIYHIRFENGGKLATPLEVLGNTTKHGTLVRFKPDPKIFTTVEFSFDRISKHLKDSAVLLKGVHFFLVDERSGEKVDFVYMDGIRQYLEETNEGKNTVGPVVYFSGENDGIDAEIALQYISDQYDEKISSYANNVHTVDGGTHETGFKAGITRAVNEYAENNNLLKGKQKLEGSDIREGIVAIISLRLPESKLEFESQTKGKLTTPACTPMVSNLVYTKFTYYLNENKEFAMRLIKKCIDTMNTRVAIKKLNDELKKGKKSKEQVILSDKLTPAQSKEYDKNELFIVEGDSAGGTAKKGRDPKYQAILPLRGKPLNTDGMTIEKILQNQEFATIINTIGAGVGQNFNVKDSHYSKVIIMTDADTDGAHIQTLLLTFFYNFMRTLITEGKVFVAVPPLYRVYKVDAKGKTTEAYAWNDNDLEEAKEQIGKSYKVSRYKGLGEMSDKQLRETTMDPKKRNLIKVGIDDALVVDKKIDILMGKDPDKRKKWLEQNVNFNENDTFIEEVIK